LVAAKPFDGEMRLAGIGRPEDGRDGSGFTARPEGRRRKRRGASRHPPDLGPKARQGNAGGGSATRSRVAGKSRIASFVIDFAVAENDTGESAIQVTDKDIRLVAEFRLPSVAGLTQTP
jgi:hypothetical protein